jgi:hypothetical protein
MFHKQHVMKTGLALVLVALMVVMPLSAALAANPHTGGTTGQPNQSCEDAGVTPGHTASAPGSAFNPDGHAGTVYAGEQPQNSRNPKSVSQYDVACFQQASH